MGHNVLTCELLHDLAHAVMRQLVVAATEVCGPILSVGGYVPEGGIFYTSLIRICSTEMPLTFKPKNSSRCPLKQLLALMALKISLISSQWPLIHKKSNFSMPARDRRGLETVERSVYFFVPGANVSTKRLKNILLVGDFNFWPKTQKRLQKWQKELQKA